MRWISLISSGHSIQIQKNTPSFQVHMEHSPGETTSWVTNQTSVNLRKLTSYQVSSPTTMLRLDINYKEKTVRNTNTCRLSNAFLHNQEVTEEIKRKIKKNSRNKWQWKHDNSKPMGCSKSSSERKVYSNTILSQETEHRVDNLNLHLKQLEKEEQKNPKVSRRKEIIKIQAE